MPQAQRIYALVEVLLEHGQGNLATTNTLENLMREMLTEAVGVDEEFMTGAYNREGEPTSYMVTDCKVIIIDGRSTANLQPKV